MAYEKISSQVPTMKGISVDLPFFRFRYVKVQDESQQQTQNTTTAQYSEKQIQSRRTVDTRVDELLQGLPARAIRVDYTEPAEVTTLGSDPLISRASVVHELVYGRMESPSTETITQTSYPVQKEYIAPSLDLIV